MAKHKHYLETELYKLIKQDKSIFDFLQLGSLDGIWYWDLEDKKNEWMSSRFWEILGYDPTKMKHLSSEWQNIIFPDDLETALNNFDKHCEDPKNAYDQIVRYRHKNGSTVWVRCRGLAIRDKSGKPVRLLGAHSDLTQVKLVEEQLHQKTIDLESANAKLQAAMKQIRVLESFVQICSYCKKIHDKKGGWYPLERYIETHTSTLLSHGICPECTTKIENDINRL